MSNLNFKSNLKIESIERIRETLFSYAIKYGLTVWLCFILADYLYSAEHWITWMVLRVIAATFFVISYYIIKNEKIKNQTNNIIILNIWMTTSVINFMVFQTGGAKSLYLPGIMLCTVFMTSIFRLNRTNSFISGLGSFGVTLVIILLASDSSEWVPIVIQSAYQIGMWVLLTVLGDSENSQLTKSIAKIIKKEETISKFENTKFLTNYVPPSLRSQLETKGSQVDKRIILTSGVVGFLDISNSTTMTSKINTKLDAHIKEQFIDICCKNGHAVNFGILNFVGDGFPFIANFENDQSWRPNLITFFNQVRSDFKELTKKYHHQIGDVETDLTCGIAMGEVALGLYGNIQPYYSTTGLSVNLAARLGSKAKAGEMVVSSRLWEYLSPVVTDVNFSKMTYSDLKGFGNRPISAFHLNLDQVGSLDTSCNHCGGGLAYTENKFYQVELKCTNYECSGEVAKVA